MNWDTSDQTRITIRNTADLNEPLMPQLGYTVTLTALTDTTMTSTLSRIAEDGITVSCIAITPIVATVGSTTINVAGEYLNCVC